MHNSQTSEFQKNSKQWSDFFTLGYNHFNQPTDSLARKITSPQDLAPASRNEAIANSEEVPVVNYTLNRTIMTVTDVWREYSCGLGGYPSIEYLEAEFGTSRRKERKESLFFSRRSELYNAIKAKANVERTSCEEATRRIEERRVQLNVLLDKLRSVIKEGNTTTIE